MSNVLRPSRNALAGLLSSVTNSPTAGSQNGACQPPCAKASLGSSSGPPGACITPSRVRNVWTVSFMSMQTEQHTDSERVSRRNGKTCGVTETPRAGDAERTPDNPDQSLRPGAQI